MTTFSTLQKLWLIVAVLLLLAVALPDIVSWLGGK